MRRRTQPELAWPLHGPRPTSSPYTPWGIMSLSGNPGPTQREGAVKIVGCSVFKTEIDHILGADAGVEWLPAGLHVSEGRLAEAVAAALEGTDGGACIYGACFPDIDQLLADHGAQRLSPARNCVEAFLSKEERVAFGDRAYILSPGYLREWRSIFIDGHGWDEIDGRINFGMYDTIVLLDFGLEPIDDLDVLEFFDFTQTPVEVVPASLAYFEERVTQLLATV
jgi:hypothetical protein